MVLSDLSIKRPVFATMMVLALVVLGIFSYRRLSIDLFPNVDLPIVTMAGEFMRGRHGAAILTMMGVTDTVTASIDDYVATAVRLGRERAISFDVLRIVHELERLQRRVRAAPARNALGATRKVEDLHPGMRRVALHEGVQRAAVQVTHQPAPPGDAPVVPDVDFITITDRGRLKRVPVAEVLYFKAELKYVTLRTANESHVMDGALSDLEQRHGERFLRIHRNALVARWAVRELERHAPTHFGDLDGTEPADTGDSWAVRIVHVDEWLAVSRRQVAAVREALAGNRG